MRATKLMMGVAVVAICATAAQADLVISTKATQNVSCSSGVCTATATNAVLNTGDLTGMLASGDLKVNTGGGATNIHVKGPVSWTSTSRLTLDANQSVEIGSPVSVTGTGAMTITTNDGGSGGDLMFDGRGNVKFWDTASSLVINGGTYTLMKDIATLASDIAANPSGFYALSSDYDASKDGTYTSSPVATELTGTFEGLGHAISGLSIAGTGTLALFADASGTLRDVGVTEVSVSGTTGGAALLVIDDQVTIVGCYATGNVVALNGGAAGGLVTGSRDQSQGGIIRRSYAAVSVTVPANGVGGGLVGQSSSSISLSYANGRVTGGNNSFLGGLMGLLDSSGTVVQSYASGAVSGKNSSDVGGLVGAGSGHLLNSYATGTVKGGEAAIVGGFAGETGGLSLGSSYSLGLVKSKTGGGFLGSASGDSFPSRNYWDIDTSGKNRNHGCGSRCPAAIKGLTTEQFQSALPEGFDPGIWGENASINGGLPYLLANPPTN